MSSSTDPYQPIEHKEKVTRSLLEVMLEDPLISYLYRREVHLSVEILISLRQFKEKVRVSMTIETDSETIRKHFTPMAPPIQARFKTLEKLAFADIPTQVAIAPILPSGEYFPLKLKQLVDRICIDDYFMGDGSGGKRTRKLEIEKNMTNLVLEEWYGPDVIKKYTTDLLKSFQKIMFI